MKSMQRHATRLCVLLSLLLAAQGVLAATFGAEFSSPRSREAMQHCAAADQTTTGHPTPQSCCSDQLGCPLMQAQLPTVPAAMTQLEPGRMSILDLPASPLCIGVTAPPLRPPILRSA